MESLTDYELINLWQDEKSFKARDTLIYRHDKLLWWNARKFKSSCYTIDDLHQEAVLIMMEAIEAYDAEKGASFMTLLCLLLRRRLFRVILERGQGIVHAVFTKDQYTIYARFSEIFGNSIQSMTHKGVVDFCKKYELDIEEVIRTIGLYDIKGLEEERSPSGKMDDPSVLAENTEIIEQVIALLNTYPEYVAVGTLYQFMKDLLDAESIRGLLAESSGYSKMYIKKLIGRAVTHVRNEVRNV